jgi:uncharacterized SAM-binding protein YcdF (DUF218 family)
MLLKLGIPAWKPLLTALALPPVPLLLGMLLGAASLRRRPTLGWTLLLAGAAGLWLGSTVAAGEWLQQRLQPPPPLAETDLRALSAGRAHSAIVVLGAGSEAYAPEYRGPNLPPLAMERLRYALWLARQTGLPVAFSGGAGHAANSGPPEAEVAAAIARRDFGQPLKWTEARSRDTRENAAASVALLRQAGVTRIVLVTHGWHMRRSRRAFERAIAAGGGGMTLLPAPMGLAPSGQPPLLRWLPSVAGFECSRLAMREMLGLLTGA